MRCKKGNGFILCGLLLLAAALLWSWYNIRTQRSAGAASQQILKELAVEAQAADEHETISAAAEAAVSALVEENVPDFVLNPEMDMPETEVNGGNYIATLSIPAISLELPVNTQWNYVNLKQSPCRYNGSAYTHDLIICAHNYDIHFGSIKYLNPGDTVILTDMDGNRFVYAVSYTETLGAFDVDELRAGDWDLTLFTCTVGGASRVTVRCELC